MPRQSSIDNCELTGLGALASFLTVAMDFHNVFLGATSMQLQSLLVQFLGTRSYVVEVSKLLAD